MIAKKEKGFMSQVYKTLVGYFYGPIDTRVNMDNPKHLPLRAGPLDWVPGAPPINMDNPKHLPLCGWYKRVQCAEKVGYCDFEDEYYENPKNMYGCYCQMFTHNHFCPCYEWMQKNRRARRRQARGLH